MYILYYDELTKLEPYEYLDIEFFNFSISKDNQDECLDIIKKFKQAKNGYIESCYYKNIELNKNIKKECYKNTICKFGFNNYISKDNKVLIIYDVSFCENKCKNCISCLNLEFLNDNSEIETLIFVKLGRGGNKILNNLPYSIKLLRIYDSEEEYEVSNLPVCLEKVELYNPINLDLEKLKLPFDCKLKIFDY
jgi:hypothetical protein